MMPAGTIYQNGKEFRKRTFVRHNFTRKENQPQFSNKLFVAL